MSMFHTNLVCLYMYPTTNTNMTMLCMLNNFSYFCCLFFFSMKTFRNPDPDSRFYSSIPGTRRGENGAYPFKEQKA